VAYDVQMKAAAHRHYEDGRRLRDAKRFDNAGYHYGLSAECAIKHLLIEVGVRGDDEVIWKHFPDLLNLAVLALEGRRAGRLRSVIRPGFMQGWDVRMRYASSGTVEERVVDRWQEHANEVMGLLYA